MTDFRGWFRGRPSIDELRTRAEAELHNNSTITVYTILHDGVELRWPARPFARLEGQMTDLAAKFAELGAAAKRAAAALEPWVAAAAAQDRRRP